MRSLPLHHRLFLLLALCGCHDFRLAEPQPKPLRSVGAPCDQAEQCSLGLCIDAFCCERSCAVDQQCDLPGKEGLCVPRAPGSSCTAQEQCPGGHCLLSGGFCCERACAAHEQCDLPNHEGLCTPRPLGGSCSAGSDCPTGFCVDGVCCDRECGERCQTCRAGPSPGTCALATANTDPRRECGQCGACFEGFCGPADVGTDPNDLCVGDSVCGPGQNCGLPATAPCATDVECAVGTCIAGRCLAASTERVFVEPMSEVPREVRFKGLAVDGNGAIAIGLGELVIEDSVFVSSSLYTLVRRPTGDWSVALEVPYYSEYLDSVRVASDLHFWNDRLFTALYQQCPEGDPPCGFYGRLFSGNFGAGPAEPLGPTASHVAWLRLRLDRDQRLLANYTWWEGSGYQIFVRRREVEPGQPPAWRDLLASPISAPDFHFETLGGRPLLVLYDDRTHAYTLRWLDPDEVADTLARPPDCSAYDLQLGRFADGDEEGLLLAFDCSYPETLLATWRPSRAAGSRWELQRLGVTRARPLAGAPAPMTLAVKPLSVVSDRADAVLLWQRPDGTWDQRTVMASRYGRFVTEAVGAIDADGFPVVLVGSSSISSSEYQTRIDLLRYHP
ncbi:MAG: hypothetical protein HY901_25645 [Deltaproteobacteria bacterium]|nr:hypothetical protein [Deltaproteobacteria bacterium]